MITPKKIGGEFDFDLKWIKNFKFSNSASSEYYLSGRVSLKVILEQIKLDSKVNNPIIHIPFYVCESVYKTCTNSGFKVKFYELNNEFLINEDYIEQIQQNEILLTINYFGIVNDQKVIESINKLKKNIITISDRVHDFYNFKESNADFSFNSLRKFFPTMAGSEIYSSKKICVKGQQVSNDFFFYKFIGSILKKELQNQTNVYLDFLKRGEMKLDKIQDILYAPDIVKFLITEVFDINHHKVARIKNAALIYTLGKEMGLEFVFNNLHQNSVPMAIPIFVKNSPKIKEKLMLENIFMPTHWPICDFNKKSKKVEIMSSQSISLPIDLRYNNDDLIRMVNCIRKNY